MLRRSGSSLLRLTSAAFQGWGTPPTEQGGWGAPKSSGGHRGSSDGGWGSSGGSGDGWGRNNSTGSGGGGWGNSSGGGGWGKSGGDGGGGWGSDSSSGGGARGAGRQWFGDDAGWKGAPTGARQRGRGSFRQGLREGGSGWGNNASSSGRGGAGVWGKPMTVDEESWSAAPPSFTPPVRHVDPLSLTAVEVEIDGIKKLVGQRVVLSGLADDTTWHTLKDHLRQAGEVSFCRVFSGGRAVAEFTTPEDAARAITELQASELEGATIFMREDREDVVLLNTRRKIREARDAQLRARKAEAERLRKETAEKQEAEGNPEAVSQSAPAPPPPHVSEQ